MARVPTTSRPVREPAQDFWRMASEQSELIALDLQIIQRGDLLCLCEIETCLCFVRIGNGGGTHFEITLGGCELLGNCGFLCLDEGDRVLRSQYLEVSLRNAQ
jgi:hypothetical protein